MPVWLACGTRCQALFSLLNLLWAFNAIRLSARAPGPMGAAFAYVLAEFPHMVIGTLCAFFVLKVVELVELAQRLGFDYVPQLLYEDFTDDAARYRVYRKGV